jgi:hypothetical protein
VIQRKTVKRKTVKRKTVFSKNGPAQTTSPDPRGHVMHKTPRMIPLMLWDDPHSVKITLSDNGPTTWSDSKEAS